MHLEPVIKALTKNYVWWYLTDTGEIQNDKTHHQKLGLVGITLSITIVSAKKAL